MQGLQVYRASRIEALAQQLAQQLADDPPASALVPQQVVVAHLGMKRWLLSELAQRRNADGSAGIAANLELLLPGEWWQRLGDTLLGPVDAMPWQHAVLRWRLYALLAGPAADPTLQRYLEDAPPRRRWQLAEHLARLYGEYQVYRADWMAAWVQGHAPAEVAWQAALWRRLLRECEAVSRVERGQQLLAALDAAAGGQASAVHVFGVSHLPPLLLQGLQLAARTRPVHLYFPDPCRELWDYLRSRRSLLRAGVEPGTQYLEVGHPLLAGLGRMGQDFALAVNADDTAQHWRDSGDEADADVASRPLLLRVQESVRRLQPELAGGERAGGARADDSLRVHACHSRLRELEVLRDALQALRAARPDLEPRQIVVMAPDIGAYASLLPAVFGVPGQWHDAGLPYHLADVPLAATHPVHAAWRQLLQLARARCTLGEILGLLDTPALARRFGLEGAARARIAGWLHEAHVAWALDASMKPAFGAPAEDLHTFAFGLDRLMAGWLLGRDADTPLLPVAGAAPLPIVPLAEASGSDFELLAGLARLLDALATWRSAADAMRSGADWSRWLAQRIEACFDAGPDDRDSREALAQLQRLAARPALETEAAALRGELPWDVLAEQQRAALDEIPAHPPYVAAGITFCGMVPQRTVPYRVVAVLGLEEGVYPRASTASSLDLIARHPRRGDRSALEEDRYLFLEALMAVRDGLHLSYVAENVADGSARNPAAPLAELLAFLDEAHRCEGDADAPWLVRHPLQPFAPVYFEQPAPGEDWRPDPALRSYARAYAGAAGAGTAPAGASPVLPAVPAASLPPAPAEAAEPCDLARLRAFLRKPAQAQARARLGVQLPETDDEAADSEPLGVRPDARLRLPARVLMQALGQGESALPERIPVALARSGQLAAGGPGQEAWRVARASALAGLRLLDGHPCREAVPDACACRFEEADGRVVEGIVPSLRDASGRHWLLRVETRKVLDFGVQLPLWLDWAALVLGLPEGNVGGCVLLHLREGAATLDADAAALPRDPAFLRRGVSRLCALHDAVLAGRAWYFPATAWAVARAEAGQRRANARKAWEGEPRHPGERDRAPGYAALLTRGQDWIADAAGWQRFEALALQLDALRTGSTP